MSSVKLAEVDGIRGYIQGWHLIGEHMMKLVQDLPFFKRDAMACLSIVNHCEVEWTADVVVGVGQTDPLKKGS